MASAMAFSHLLFKVEEKHLVDHLVDRDVLLVGLFSCKQVKQSESHSLIM